MNYHRYNRCSVWIFFIVDELARNILITIAESIDNIFYEESNDATGAGKNLCAYLAGMLGTFAYLDIVTLGHMYKFKIT